MLDHDPSPDSAKRTLSEISHLFLSDVRERQTGGMPRPQRTPPGQQIPAAPAGAASLPQNTDSAAGPALNDSSTAIARASEPAPEPETVPVPPVIGVLAAHLSGGPSAGVRQYARHLAARIGRIGLIEVDGPELQITCFEPAGDNEAFRNHDGPFPASEIADVRSLAEAIEELDWDVQRWLLTVSSLRGAEACSLAGEVKHWALLSTCNHDGVVSSYRAIKGLHDIVPTDRPRLTLALLDTGEPEADRVFAKLSGVCEQFLNWRLEPEPAVLLASGVTDYPVLRFRQGLPLPDGATHWSVLADRAGRAAAAELAAPQSFASGPAGTPPCQLDRRLVGDTIIPMLQEGPVDAGDQREALQGEEFIVPPQGLATDCGGPSSFPSPDASVKLPIERAPGEDPLPRSQHGPPAHPGSNIGPDKHASACHPERSEGSLPLAAEEALRCAQGDGYSRQFQFRTNEQQAPEKKGTPPRTYTAIADLAATPGAALEEFVMNEQPAPAGPGVPVAPTSVIAADAVRLGGEPAVPAQAAPASPRRNSAEVLDVGPEGSAESILAAIVARPESGLVECPVRAPMCPSARLTIDRDRRVILLAVAREGLADLRSIGQAYRWLIENRALIGMAVPQFAIDAHQFPRLRLLVDQADASADVLQPMLESGHVAVQAYRRVRWGARTGLLLDAA